MTFEEQAKLLESAASALRHGRLSTARKKVGQVYAELLVNPNLHDLDQHDASCNGMSPCDMSTEREED